MYICIYIHSCKYILVFAYICWYLLVSASTSEADHTQNCVICVCFFLEFCIWEFTNAILHLRV